MSDHTTPDPMDMLRRLNARISPALTGDAPLDSYSCVLCGPLTACICHTIEFGSNEYFARLDRAHGRQPREDYGPVYIAHGEWGGDRNGAEDALGGIVSDADPGL
jgi:hypothetical protein